MKSKLKKPKRDRVFLHWFSELDMRQPVSRGSQILNFSSRPWSHHTTRDRRCYIQAPGIAAASRRSPALLSDKEVTLLLTDLTEELLESLLGIDILLGGLARSTTVFLAERSSAVVLWLTADATRPLRIQNHKHTNTIHKRMLSSYPDTES